MISVCSSTSTFTVSWIYCSWKGRLRKRGSIYHIGWTIFIETWSTWILLDVSECILHTLKRRQCLSSRCRIWRAQWYRKRAVKKINAFSGSMSPLPRSKVSPDVVISRHWWFIEVKSSVHTSFVSPVWRCHYLFRKDILFEIHGFVFIWSPAVLLWEQSSMVSMVKTTSCVIPMACFLRL